MKTAGIVLTLVLAAGLIAGCKKKEEQPSAANATTPAANAGLTQVKLSVPNMTWGGCATSVRGALEKIDGVVDIEPDINNRTVSFRLKDKSVDYSAKLEELAKSNSHLAGYTVVN